jgi:hypothetical protein
MYTKYVAQKKVQNSKRKPCPLSRIYRTTVDVCAAIANVHRLYDEKQLVFIKTNKKRSRSVLLVQQKLTYLILIL